MKAALALAALLAAIQPQQQTFYSAKAEPKPVPVHTAQPFNPDYLYYLNCAKGRRGHAGSKPSSGRTAHTPNGNCSRGSHSGSHPSPHPSRHPEPRRG